MSFVVKAALDTETASDELTFVEKTMYGGKAIRPDDEIFIFASDHEGGRGLWARGVVTSVKKGPNIRLTITVRPVAKARRKLGRTELKPFRERVDNSPQTEMPANSIARRRTRSPAFPTRPQRSSAGISRPRRH